MLKLAIGPVFHIKLSLAEAIDGILPISVANKVFFTTETEPVLPGRRPPENISHKTSC